MNKIFMYSFLVVLLCVVASCKKNNDGPHYSMTADVSMAFNFGSSDTTYNLPFSATGDSDVTALDSGGSCYIHGSQNTGDQRGRFDFWIKKYTGPGVYYLSDSVVGYYDTQAASFNVSVSYAQLGNGMLTISVSGETVTGTFGGSAYGFLTVTNGRFTAAGRGF